MAKQREQVALKKGVSSFHLVGKTKIGQNTFNIDSESQSSDWIFSSMQLGVDTGNGNTVYANLMGGYGAERENVIYVHGKTSDNKDDYENQFTVDWDDRFDEDILDSIGNGCFIRVGIEKDNKGKIFTKRFLSAYDAVEYLNEHLENDMVVSVRGNLQYQYYKENTSVNKNITSIYATNVEEDKYCAKFEQTILLDSDSVGKVDKEKGTFGIDAYVVDYVGKVDGEQIKKNVSFAKFFELEVNKNKPELTKRVIEKYFKVKKKGDIVELGVEGILQEGASITTTSLEDLPDDIKDLLELELITEEEALAKVTDGKKERRMIITKPLARKSGEGEDMTVTIVRDEDKYKVDDLVFLESLLNTEDDDEEESVETSADNTEELLSDLEESEDTNEEASDDEWLKALMED